MTLRTGSPSPVRLPVRLIARVGSIALTAGLLLLLAAPAQAYTQADRTEQTRYARETMNLTYTAFLTRKADFARAGCRVENYENNGAPYPQCRKPSPYNAFNWTDDGCSGRDRIGFLSNAYRNLFNKPCQLHYFGYRNFGKGLTLGRDESTRAWIDARFRTEMYRLCDSTYAGNRAQRVACTATADAVWRTVRGTGGNWNTPPEMPLAPLDPVYTPAPAPLPGPVSVPANPTFPVMNTSETPPDGVWFRNSPRTGDTSRITGLGIYAGEKVQLNCYAWGESVGNYGNRLWYQAQNLNRPTVVGRSNNGFLNAHYVNDGMAANQIAAGVRAC